MGAEFCHTDGRTLVKKTVAIRNFAKALKKAKPLTQLTAVVATYQ
jgi:hypothetical protein